MAGISQTHFAPESGKRKTRFRINKTAVAERANFAVADALQATGDAARLYRGVKKPKA